VPGLAILLFPLFISGSFLAPAAPSQVPNPSPVENERNFNLTSSPAETNAVEQRVRGRFGGVAAGVYKSRVTPHWFENNTRFWYRNELRAGASEFIVVDSEMGHRQPAFDHEKMAAALSKAVGTNFSSGHLPFAELEFIEDGKAIRFDAAGKTWRCDLTSYECTTTQPPPAASSSKPSEESGAQSDENRQGRPRDRARNRPRDDAVSPDGKWSAFIKDHNVWLRSTNDNQEFQLTQDGKEDNGYSRLEWSPDSKAFVAWRIERGDRKEVYLIRSSPPGGGRAQFESRPYALPGDKFTQYELGLFDLASRKQIKPEVDRFEHEWEAPRLRWGRDDRHFTYEQVDRGHQRFRVIEVDAHTGGARNLIDERTETFFWTAHTENLNINYVNWLEKTDEMIYVSERDGWRHLYLVDTKEGKIKNQITSGQWVVRGIDLIDEDKRQVWFRASGMNSDQDPYFIHYYRINFDGTGLIALTDGNGTHTVQYSGDRKYLIDTYSRVDIPPVHVLRRVADCAKISQFEAADISELQEKGWKPPEVFIAKGRDGKTDIWGIVCRPRDFDPAKKYPVLESVYAGPQSSYVPKSFSGRDQFGSLTALGFVVVQADGMGTANRSKAFHDVCWKNLKDAGFPDRILWHKALAAKYPWYDLSRVGIYGVSAGAQSAAGGLLFYPDFYKCAVAACGCHDNRMDKASWNEQWMGYPVGPQYAECSNIENASRLRGRLLLIVGEMDHNVPPESTMRFVDALIKAGKDFDLLVVPGADHGMGGSYGQRKMEDFFVRNLLGKEPSDRNSGS
jgi:dipeptidyl aminopeptidase/acylaminoacyl peptidase